MRKKEKEEGEKKPLAVPLKPGNTKKKSHPQEVVQKEE